MRRLFPATTAFLLLPLLSGCSDLRLLEPAGPIGVADRNVILVAFGLMLIVLIPVVIMSVAIPWHYRATNTKAVYAPNWKHSNRIEAVVWTIPALIVAALGVLVWASTHRLDPYKPIASAHAPVEVEAVSMDWKWLFIYPRLGIATVNELAFPAKTPLQLRITSDSVMTALFIPRLGSQIYAMAGMQTRLNLVADKPGKYLGENTQYSGDGFSRMNFDALAMSRKDFNHWVKKVRQSPQVLDRAGLAQLEKPSTAVPVQHFSAVGSDLFDSIIAKYKHPSSGRAEAASAAVHQSAPAPAAVHTPSRPAGRQDVNPEAS